MDWNATADALAAEQKLPQSAARRAAWRCCTWPMFEAVNAIDRRYQPYQLKPGHRSQYLARSGRRGCRPRRCLLALYPDAASPALDAMLAQSPRSGGRRSVEAARPHPRAQGGRAIFWRCARDDGSDAPETYRPVTQPGAYVPTAPVVSAGSSGAWIQPWVMSSARAVPSRAAARADLGGLDARLQRNSRARRRSTAGRARAEQTTGGQVLVPDRRAHL